MPPPAVTRASRGYVRLVLAPNPGPMTLDGTNSWVLGDPAVAPPVVVDPGPAIPGHLEAVLAAAGGRVAVVLLTHRHADHAEGAAELARRAGCGVRAVDPAWRVGAEGLAQGDEIAVGRATLTVHLTPGHTGDSCSLLLRGPDGDARLLTGDTVLGRGTSVVAEPDGDLGDYLRSLELLQRLLGTAGVVELLPGHGPRVGEPAARLDYYRRHREQRLTQVRAALEAGDRSAAEVVGRVYADADESVRPAAEQSVRAQLRYLRERSELPG